MDEQNVVSAPGDKDWDLYAAHRARLTDAILESADGSTGRRASVVLGAGACTILILARAARGVLRYLTSSISTARRSLAASRATTAPGAARALHRHGASISRAFGASTRWRLAAPEAAELPTMDGLCHELPGPFDVVASTCVLTQMAFALREALGERHPALEAARFALMRTHLSSLVALTAPGGTALLRATWSRRRPSRSRRSRRRSRT